MTIFYVGVLFYFKFNESISLIKIIGTILMIPCIAFMSLGASTSSEETQEAEEAQ